MNKLLSLLAILALMSACGVNNEEDPFATLGADNEDIIETGLDSVSESMGELDESDG